MSYFVDYKDGHWLARRQDNGMTLHIEKDIQALWDWIDTYLKG